MVYIVMDLEWNSVYAMKIRGYINEIIEIGAVMLDGQLRELSHFSVLVRSRIGTRLQNHVREMTHLSREELIMDGLPFSQAVGQFKSWIGGRDHVLLTWGDGDIRVLLSNTRYLTGSQRLDYLRNYVDLQQYFHHRKQFSRAQQVGLAAAGETLGLNRSDYALHRALDDSRFAAECFRRIYSEEDFGRFVRPCDPAFFAELEYKPRVISDIRHPLVDAAKLYYNCRACGQPARRMTDWRFASRGFQAVFYCERCGQYVKAMICFKKLYNSIEIRRSARVLQETPAELEGKY